MLGFQGHRKVAWHHREWLGSGKPLCAAGCATDQLCDLEPGCFTSLWFSTARERRKAFFLWCRPTQLAFHTDRAHQQVWPELSESNEQVVIGWSRLSVLLPEILTDVWFFCFLSATWNREPSDFILNLQPFENQGDTSASAVSESTSHFRWP